jgi:hypothetical protein
LAVAAASNSTTSVPASRAMRKRCFETTSMVDDGLRTAYANAVANGVSGERLMRHQLSKLTHGGFAK